VSTMEDARGLTTAQLQAQALEILGGDPADRSLWDAHYAEVFALTSSTREPRHQRYADRWSSEIKRAFVLRAFDHARFEAGPQHWPLEIRALWSLRVRIRNEF
jgi:hypothetical protein